MQLNLYSWNINGIRAAEKKGFLTWFKKTQPDVLCLQETKAWEAQLSPALLQVKGYQQYFSQPERKGYSGVAIYSKPKPLAVETTFGSKKFDSEGRVLIAEYPEFILLNVYFPNGGASTARLNYKLEFYAEFLNYLKKLMAQGKCLILCGDLNTAHQAIDLARPKENEKNSGFMPVERAWLDKYFAAGFIDTFRKFNTQPQQYTWWDQKTRARERNVGWRIDYFLASKNLEKQITAASIYPKIMGSDHCPINLILNI